MALCQERPSLQSGLTLAGILWLIMMTGYSPVIGWGVFGFGGAGHSLGSEAPLHLGSPVTYLGATLLLHLIYGAIIGGLNPRWMANG